MSTIILDTGFWYALFDPRDDSKECFHSRAQEHAYLIDGNVNRILFPWPVVYETLRTKFVKNVQGMEGLQRVLRGQNVQLEDDQPYRSDALDLCWQSCLIQKRKLSLVDCVLRLMLDDANLRVDVFVTFNPRDFHDVCKRNRVEMVLP
jgi:hypothetical protein